MRTACWKAKNEGHLIIVLSALAAHQAWHLFIERGQAWWQYPLPRLVAADLSQMLGWATAALLVGLVLWGSRERLTRLMADD